MERVSGVTVVVEGGMLESGAAALGGLSALKGATIVDVDVSRGELRVKLNQDLNQDDLNQDDLRQDNFAQLPECLPRRGAMAPMDYDDVDSAAHAESASLRAWCRKEREVFASIMLDVARSAKAERELMNFRHVADCLRSRGFDRNTADAVMYYYGRFKRKDKRYAKFKSLKFEKRLAWQNRELMDEVWQDVRRVEEAKPEAIESSASAKEKHAEDAQDCAGIDDSETESEYSEFEDYSVAFEFGDSDDDPRKDSVENTAPTSASNSGKRMPTGDDYFDEMLAIGSACVHALKRRKIRIHNKI